jgi:hypothetical protein
MSIVTNLLDKLHFIGAIHSQVISFKSRLFRIPIHTANGSRQRTAESSILRNPLEEHTSKPKEESPWRGEKKMARQGPVGLRDFTRSPEFLSNEEQTIIRSIIFVQNGTPRNVLRKTHGIDENGDIEQIFTVTDLLDDSRYLVESMGSGYRLYFPLDRGEVIVELASEADLPTIAHDLGRRFSELGARAF